MARRRRLKNKTKKKISRALKQLHRKGVFNVAVKTGAGALAGAAVVGTGGAIIGGARAKEQELKSRSINEASINDKYDKQQKDLFSTMSKEMNNKNHQQVGWMHNQLKGQLEGRRKAEMAGLNLDYRKNYKQSIKKTGAQAALAGAGIVGTYAAIKNTSDQVKVNKAKKRSRRKKFFRR